MDMQEEEKAEFEIPKRQIATVQKDLAHGDPIEISRNQMGTFNYQENQDQTMNNTDHGQHDTLFRTQNSLPQGFKPSVQHRNIEDHEPTGQK